MRPDKREINQGKFKVLHVAKEIKGKDIGRQEVQGKQAMAAETTVETEQCVLLSSTVQKWEK